MLSNRSMQTKIQSVMLPLVSLILALTVVLGFEYYQQWDRANGLESAYNYVELSSALVHQWQKERGKSVQYLNGKVTLEELQLQRSEVLAKQALLEKFLTTWHDDQIVKPMKQNLELHQELIAKVDAKGPAAEVAKGYAGIIESTILFQHEAAEKFPVLGLDSTVIGLSVLELAKENVGKFRALSSKIAGQDGPASAAEIDSLLVYKNSVIVDLHSPALKVQASTEEKISKITSSAEWMYLEKTMSTIQEKALTGGYGLSDKEVFVTVTKIVDSLYDILVQEQASTRLLVKNVHESARNLFWGLLALCTLCTLCITFVMIYGFSTWKKINLSLSAVTDELSEGAEFVSSASTKLSGYSSELSTGVSDQSCALQETVASLDEVQAMVSKNAESAEIARTETKKTTTNVEHGGNSIKQMLVAIDDIEQSNALVKAQVDVSNKKLEEIVHVITEINGKTKVINDIVFQTKLLSFNASVEAARAGEHGSGFAVVAQEVGNLAQMSGVASKEITILLDTSMNQVDLIINETKEKVGALVASSMQKIAVGKKTAGECATIFESILSGVQKANQAVEEIAVAGQEQSIGVTEIAKAMNQLDKVTQENSAAADKTATSSLQLNDQSMKLRQTAQSLFRVVYGKTAEQKQRADHGGKTSGNVVQLGTRPKINPKVDKAS